MVKDTTINWRIYNLVKDGILERVGRGKFKPGKSKIWIPDLSPGILTLNRKLKKQFPFLTLCIWSNSVFNEFMVHQLFRSFILAEVEKDAMEAVFYWLKDARYDAVIDPSDDYINRFLSVEGDKVIIKPLVSEAPLRTIKETTMPALEKVLVDLVCDKSLFGSQQGTELRNIFTEAFRKYSVLSDRLLRYAGRRGKREELIILLDKFQISGNID